MVGENKPSCEVTVGESGDYDWATADTWQKPSTTYTANGLSVAKKSNGNYIVCNTVGGTTIYEAEVNSIDDLISLDNSATGWVSTGLSSLTHAWATLWNYNGGLYMTFSDAGSPATSPARQTIYKSPSGNGGDWVLYSTIQSFTYTFTNVYDSHALNLTGIPVVLSNGRWILVTGKWIDFSSYLVQNAYVWTSDDGGVTWTGRYLLSAYMMAHDYYASINKQIYISPDGNLYSCFSEAWGNVPLVIIKSADKGLTWAEMLRIESYTTFYDHSYMFAIIDNKSAGFYVIMASLSVENISIWNFDTPDTDINSYEFVKYLPTGVIGGIVCPVEIDDKLIIIKGYTVLGIATKAITIPVKSVSISRNKNMAGSLNVTLDNKDGIYSPDNINSSYAGVMLPNTQVSVKQGYGAELITTFTGLVDSVEMSTFPQEIKLSIRDKLKLALDQTVTSSVNGSHLLKYTNYTVEAIFTDLCGKAGLTIETIETTGITLAFKTFQWETYGDAFSYLADLVGFEFSCDENGLINFRKDTIPTSPTIAYTFREGEDIISLGYTIDDNELYYSAVCYGQSGNAVISATSPFGNRDFFNILPQKVLKIDASDTDTIAKCQAIADRATNLMVSRSRIVNFAAIAVPWLQIGDFIIVIESSTTISEVYRVTDLSTNQDNNGYTMNITCYHHSAG
jgi:hypothetical protein